MTVCNVLVFIPGEVLASFLSAYGRVEEINLLRSAAGAAYGDYMFRLCLTREGFSAIPEIIISRERQMMVIVEGRRSRCWGCKQLGHIAKFCPPKDQQNATAATVATATKVITASISSEQPTKGTAEKDPGSVQSKTPQSGRGLDRSDPGKKKISKERGKQACVCLS